MTLRTVIGTRSMFAVFPILRPWSSVRDRVQCGLAETTSATPEVLYVAAAIWSLFGVVFALSRNMTLAEYLVKLFLPSAPAYLDSIELARSHVQHSQSREQLENDLDDLWDQTANTGLDAGRLPGGTGRGLHRPAHRTARSQLVLQDSTVSDDEIHHRGCAGTPGIRRRLKILRSHGTKPSRREGQPCNAPFRQGCVLRPRRLPAATHDLGFEPKLGWARG